MTDKLFVEMETAINSPQRGNVDKQSAFSGPSYLLLSTTRNSSQKMSQTEEEIYSHQLIRDLMQSRQKRILTHNVHRVPNNVELYARPVEHNKSQFDFKCIPPENHMYSSQCNSKIQQIRQGLNSKQDRVKNKRPQSAKIDNGRPRVSVSGLVSYSFKTVKGRKSIGYNQVNNEQILIKDLKDVKKRQYCSLQRKQKIMKKSSGPRYSKYKKNQEAILSDFKEQVESYLAGVRSEKQQNTLIYNQKSKKLSYIKEYMLQERTKFQDASQIVSEIEGKPQKKKVSAKQKIQINEEDLLIGRKMPVQRKPLTVRQFSFLD